MDKIYPYENMDKSFNDICSDLIHWRVSQKNM